VESEKGGIREREKILQISFKKSKAHHSLPEKKPRLTAYRGEKAERKRTCQLGTEGGEHSTKKSRPLQKLHGSHKKPLVEGLI